MQIGSLRIVNTSKMFGLDTRMSTLLYAPPKYGKTTMASTMDAMTKKHLGKPTLYIMCEAGDGGGALSVKDAGIDCVFPETLEDLESILTWLYNDTTYGGVVMDSVTEMVNRIMKPYILATPTAGANPVELSARKEGVPVRLDYNKMNERGRMWLNRLVGLTTIVKTEGGTRVPDLDRRKHVLATAHTKIKSDQDGTIIKIQPDLPGQLAENACGLFQSVITLNRSVVNKTIDNRKVAVPNITVVSEIVGLPYILGDRFGIFENGSPPDFVHIYENNFLPKFSTN